MTALAVGAWLGGCAGVRPGPAEHDTAFVCTQVMGVAVTRLWYAAGFEEGLDGSRWQELARPFAHLPSWADPESPFWWEAPASPCASNAHDPDRVVLVAVHWDYRSEEEWVRALDAAVANLVAKYPSLRRVELLTGLRGPGNDHCGHPKRHIPPFVDRAIERVAAANPRLVRAGPRFEVPRCDLFEKGPYLSAEGKSTVARMMGAHYAREP